MYTRPLYAAGNSQPATNVLGFRNDTKRLRGKYLADCSPFHRRKPRGQNAERGIRNAENLKPAPACIDDGD